MDAIAYIRWSTLNQEDGDSLERQEKLVRSVAKDRGWPIIELHVESGKSAYHGRNRAQKGKLREIEERAARGELAGKVLIVEAMDRLSRQEPLESLNLLVGLCKQGLTICEAGTNTIYDTAKINENWANLVVALAKAGEAHDSSKLKARRVSNAWRRTQETGKTKDGSDDPRLCPAWMEVLDGKFTVIESRAEVIRGMYQRCIEGWGLRKICHWANEERARLNWPAAAWHIRSVTVTIHGRRTLGEYQPQMRNDHGRTDAGEPVKLYPAIVTEETWHRAMAGLATRKGTGGPRNQCVNVLSHLCRCQHRPEGSNIPCGSRMSVRKQRSGPTQIFCADFARAGECRCNANYRYDDILKGLLDNLSAFAMPAPEPAADSAAGRIAIARAELQHKRTRLDEIADELMENPDDVKERAYQRFKARIEDDAAALKLMEGQEAGVKARPPRPELAAQIASLRDQMEESVEARLAIQAALDQFIDVILMDPVERTATVVMLDGNLVMKLSNRGKVLGVVDSLLMLQPRTYVMSDGTKQTFDPRVDGRTSTNPLAEISIDHAIDQVRRGALRGVKENA